MGIVAFWGPIHGQGRISLNTSLLSTYMSLKNSIQILVMDSQFTYSRLQDIVCPSAEDGTSKVFTFAQTNNLTPESFKMYTTNIIDKKLYILGATKQQLVNNYISSCFKSILDCANQSYDMVFIDTNAGVYDHKTTVVLENADLIVVNLPQENYILEKFFKRENGYWHPVLDNKNHIYVIGGYHDDYDHYNDRRIKRNFGLDELYIIPDNKFLHKAVTEQRFIQWMISHYDDTKSDNAYLFESLLSITGRISGMPRKKTLFSVLAETLSKG